VVEEISRWLRRVRPSTAADDGWQTSSEAEQVLAAVHRAAGAAAGADDSARDRVPEPGSGRRPVGVRRWAPAGVLAGGIAAVVAIALTSSTAGRRSGHVPFAGGPGSSTSTPTLPAIRPAAFLLKSYPSCSGLLASLRSHTASSATGYGLPGLQALGNAPYLYQKSAGQYGPLAVAASGPTIGVGQNTSATNVQEQGVDEPDIAKTDGDRLVTITDGVLRVVDTTSQKVTGTLDLTMYSGWQGAQLLVSGTHAVVLLGANSATSVPYSFGPLGGSATSESTYLFVSLTGQPSVTGSMRAAGAYLGARMVGSTIRLVVGSAPTINLPAYSGTSKAKKANQQAIGKAPIAAWLPKYTVTTSAGTVSRTVGCDRISHPADYTGTSMLTIYTLDATNPGLDPNPVSVAADGDTVYATSSSLYIASNPDWYCCSSAATKQNTEIHRFDISGSSAPTYLGSGTVSGRLLSQYSLSEEAGYLRIATTSGEADGSAGASNSVVVLAADTLKITGRVDGLGKGERIYAVRFLGPTAYVVTFKQTDPLYVIDLRDPDAPKLAGTLALSGFSDYLHDAGSGRLLGVGQEASASGRVAGLQVSLFDVTNPASPRRTGHVVLSKSPGEANLDPHAFLYWQPTGLVVTPIQSWDSTQSGKVLVLKLSGDTLSKVGVLANPRATATLDDQQGIQRSFIVNGDLWTISGSGVQVSAQSTLTRLAWIPYQ
jgi:uncharacterized secreted protein with C-terminal beta-propeller domain